MKVKEKVLLIVLFILMILLFSSFTTNSFAYTELEVNSKLVNEIKYKEGFKEGQTCNNVTGGNCHEWALMVCNELFGSSPRNNYEGWSDVSVPNVTANDVKPGDLLRFNAGGFDHTIVALGCDENNLYYADCNWGVDCEVCHHPMNGDSICWNRGMSWSTLRERMSRYLTESGQTGRQGRVIHYKNYYKDGSQVITKPKITWMTLNMNQSISSLGEFEVRVWTECSVGMEKVSLKVWKSGTNIPYDTTMAYNSSGKYWYKLIKASNVSGWKNDISNVCCASAVAVNNKNEASDERAIYDTPVGGLETALGNFTARIVPTSNTNFAVKLMGNNNGDAIKLANKSLTDKAQIWKFVKDSNGYYEITNTSNNKVITVLNAGDSDANPLIGWDDNNSAHAKFLIQKYNDGYRIIAGNSGVLRAMDIYENKVANGTLIEEYVNGNTQFNRAQTFKFEIIETSIKKPFPDVELNKWYTESIQYVKDKGYITGYANGNYGPNDNITRAQIATILYRVAGSPKVSGSTTLKDEKTFSKWYKDAVVWANQKGIITGYADGNFGPNDNIKRQDLATMLGRYAQYVNKEVMPKVTTLNKARYLAKFDDKNSISSYATQYAMYCVKNNIITGKERNNKTYFDPQSTATRAEVATMIMRFCEK